MRLPPLGTERESILIVEDDGGVRQMMLKALSRSDHEVVIAGTVAEALAHLESRAFTLLITDKNLPDGSGLEVIEQARKRGDITEAIIITGYSDTDSAIRAVDLRVFRYLKKPLDLFEFDVDVRRAIESAELRRELKSRTMELEGRNAELQQAIDREREADARRVQSERLATLGYVAAGVAHELNNPIAVLAMTIPPAGAALRSLLDEPEGRPSQEPGGGDTGATLARVAAMLAPTEDALNLLMSLARDLHALGRTAPRDPRPVSLAAVAASALRLSHHQVRYKAGTEVDVPADLRVLGWENRLIQIFINLLTNAARAITDGEPERNRVSIRARKEGRHVVVKVADTGCGISPYHLERIFTRFYTQPASGQGSGSGIGLSIVHEAVTDHGGTIEVESRLGAGTTFTIRLPSAPETEDVA